jgi:hypothetical protein
VNSLALNAWTLKGLPMLTLEYINKDAHVSGIQTNEIVRTVTVEPVGENAITVYFKDN